MRRFKPANATTKWALTIDSTCTSSSQLPFGVVWSCLFIIGWRWIERIRCGIFNIFDDSHQSCDRFAMRIYCFIRSRAQFTLSGLCLVNSITIRYVKLIKTPLYLLSQLCLTEQQFSRRLEATKKCLICLIERHRTFTEWNFTLVQVEVAVFLFFCCFLINNRLW